MGAWLKRAVVGVLQHLWVERAPQRAVPVPLFTRLRKELQDASKFATTQIAAAACTGSAALIAPPVTPHAEPG